MYFHKVSTPANFRFTEKKSSALLTRAQKEFSFTIHDLGEDVFRLTVRNPKLWNKNHSQATLSLKAFRQPSLASLALTKSGELHLTRNGTTVFASDPQATFGVCGPRWMMGFLAAPSDRFYGMGEKNNGFEKSGVRTKFWNTDVWADFNMAPIMNGSTDPMYVSVPYLLMRSGNQWLGLLINNPYATFMNIAAGEKVANQQNAGGAPRRNYFGSDNGVPEIYFIAGESAASVTERLQRLCGTTPLPPLWSLGNNQCRWGYESVKDLENLDQQFTRYQIPCDGLWLDIDYMEHFKVFTFNKDHFPHNGRGIKELAARGRRVVPILDPGVKAEPGYEVFDSGCKEGIFCKNPEGGTYIGFVWPGATAFPDFSREEGRRWWAKWVARFAESGVGGAWLDMNDPAVGSSELDQMLFGKEGIDHGSYHNQYALGMQMASRDGFLMHNPKRRPFLLSRSGFISTSRYAALWTGDNYSNYHHMRGSIAMTLNLALSGIPFNGPDVPGFGGDATGEILVAWHKTGFLFPVFRNHAIKGSRVQEPWAFGREPRKIAAHYLRLRYKLLPYLYSLFINQEESGSAILRPLFYDFGNTKKVTLDFIADQFMVGPAIMQAPVVVEGATLREVTLPAGRWFDPSTSSWVKGDRVITAHQTERSTPIYLREGAVIPMQKGERKDNANDLSTIECHVLLDRLSKGTATLTYAFDDGESYAYQKGERSRVQIEFSVVRGTLRGRVTQAELHYRPLSLEIVSYGGFSNVEISEGETTRKLPLTAGKWTFSGSTVNCERSRFFKLS